MFTKKEWNREAYVTQARKAEKAERDIDSGLRFGVMSFVLHSYGMDEETRARLRTRYQEAGWTVIEKRDKDCPLTRGNGNVTWQFC